MRPKRFSSIVNKLKCDRFGLAKYPFRMAGKYNTSFLSTMVNGKQVLADHHAMVDYQSQLAWIRANRLPHPENK